MKLERYVALLRGINVGRANRVPMAELRALLEDLGFSSVRTLLNSGNAVFESVADEPIRIAGRIERGLAERLDVRVSVVVLSASELATVAAENPLVDLAENPSRLIVAFWGETTAPKVLEPLLAEEWQPEAFALGSRAAYLWCPAGVTESPLSRAVVKATGDSLSTSRNWATVVKLQALLGE